MRGSAAGATMVTTGGEMGRGRDEGRETGVTVIEIGGTGIGTETRSRGEEIALDRDRHPDIMTLYCLFTTVDELLAEPSLPCLLCIHVVIHNDPK